MGLKRVTCWPVAVVAAILLMGCAEKPASSTQLTPDTNNSAQVQTVNDTTYQTLLENFQTSPDSARPLTWYHVMNSNLSAAGITKDFEAMAENGIGGVLYFNLGRNIAKGKVLFDSERHIELVGHMASEAKRLGLSFGIHNADGWTSSGGPWVTPEQSMKQVTWNETLVTSNQANGGNVKVKLPQPWTVLDYYQDIAVLAYPALETELVDAKFKPTITASDPNFDVAKVFDGIPTNSSMLKQKNGQPVWLQFSYEKPITIRFLGATIGWGRNMKYELHYSNDGINFKRHTKLEASRPFRTSMALDGAFAGVTAKYFRLVANNSFRVAEVQLSSTPRMGHYLGRTLATHTDFHKLPGIGAPKKSHAIDASKIVNLTGQLSEGGELNAQLPPGQWTIMRFGYTSKGTTNFPPTAEGLGLEVDKFSREAFKSHYDAYITNVINKVKQVAPNALQYLEIDSYEVGGQNWTKGYEQHFKDKFGYDLLPFLPLFAGKFVDSAATTEAVAWDIRNLSTELMTKNYYQYFTELAHQDGLKTYNEPYGNGPINELDVGGKVDIPMGEFWLKRNIYMLAAATSVGHIYNKNIISAEAFTATKEHNWKFNPAYAKFDGDKAWALGVNELVFHRFVHQANTHVVPGMTMEHWGAHVDATQPWFNTAGKAWFKYLARGQYLLRQGQPVADMLWFVGDAAPSSCPDRNGKEVKQIPTAINYDCINSEKLQELTYQDGRYHLAHGVKYKLLHLANHETLSLASLEKIYQFAKQGGVIIGEPTKQLAGLHHNKAQLAEFNRMVDYIWSQPTTHKRVKSVGWQALYQQHGLNFDLQVKDLAGAYYAHRKTAAQEIYFVYNDTGKRQLFDASFEVTGKVPELWDARTGKTKKLAAFSQANGMTQVAFRLEPNESAFVVFNTDSRGKSKLSPQVVREQDVEALYDEQFNPYLLKKNRANSQTLTGSWQVTFEKAYGLDKSVTFETLTNWKDSTNPEIRAYSGIATYTKRFSVSADLLSANQRVSLDLGNVSDSAQVFINGKEVGIAWLAPFTLDVTGFMRPGENQLTVKVANAWTNRLISDESLIDSSGYWQANGKHVPVMPDWYSNNQPLPNLGKQGHRRTFSTYKFVKKGDPLVDSGLLGLVTLTATQAIGLTQSH